MRTLFTVLLAAVAVVLVSCSDGLSTDEARPLASEEDMVYGIVYDNQNPPQPVEGTPVIVYKRMTPANPWIDIDQINTNEDGYYEFHLDPWPAGWDGKVDCTNDLYTGLKDFSPYPQQGPVEADIYLSAKK